MIWYAKRGPRKRRMKQRTLELIEVALINPREFVMTLDEMRSYIESVRWQFAKTMPDNPHEYTIKKWAPTRAADFEDVVMFIRETGYKKAWKNPSTGRSTTYTYLDVDGRCYWTMGAPLDQTILINRAIVDPALLK